MEKSYTILEISYTIRTFGILNNTRLEQASTNRYNFGDFYQDNGRTFLKLNLQVRSN
ncbi:MAG: HpaII family restriction endonuclease [Gelidibacter sp.]|nr:HpaII family restriction endonuclease [Gelidibacter sp.]